MELTDGKKKSVAPFLRSLYVILSQEDDTVVGWTENGDAFEVRDFTKFTEHILPRYFRHRKYASFQRQLNYFGFKKLTKSRANVCTYVQAHFQRGKPDALVAIKRKTNSGNRPRSRGNSIEQGMLPVLSANVEYTLSEQTNYGSLPFQSYPYTRPARSNTWNPPSHAPFHQTHVHDVAGRVLSDQQSQPEYPAYNRSHSYTDRSYLDDYYYSLQQQNDLHDAVSCILDDPVPQEPLTPKLAIKKAI